VQVVREYPPPPDAYVAYPTPTLWSRSQELPRSPEIDIPWQKIESRYKLTLENLGPFGAELFLYTDLKQRVSQLMDNCIESTNPALSLQYLHVEEQPTDPDHLPELEGILRVVSQYDWLFADDVQTPIDPNWCTPKVMVLVDILLAHHTQEFQGITFVEQRHIAACLAKTIPRFPQAQGYLKCAELIGHGSGGVTKSSVKGMPTSFQRDVVQMFRDREVNLCKLRAYTSNNIYYLCIASVIATSVAEEGLDFPVSRMAIYLYLY
jgi:endoribonuclease Dicer